MPIIKYRKQELFTGLKKRLGMRGILQRPSGSCPLWRTAISGPERHAVALIAGDASPARKRRLAPPPYQIAQRALIVQGLREWRLRRPPGTNAPPCSLAGSPCRSKSRHLLRTPGPLRAASGACPSGLRPLGCQGQGHIGFTLLDNQPVITCRSLLPFPPPLPAGKGSVEGQVLTKAPGLC